MREFFFKTYWSKLASMICVAAVVLLLTSCLDDDDQATDPLPVAYVSIYHESPDAPSLDVLVDGRPVNRLEFTDYTGYLNFYTGDRNFKVNSFNATNALIDTTVNFVDGGFYSVFIVNNLSKVETLTLRDSADSPVAGTAQVRFINLSPDAPALDVTAAKNSSPIFSNQAFKNPSTFTEVDASTSYFGIKSAGATAELVSISDIDIEEGRFYTIIVRGFLTPPAGNNNALNMEVIKH